MLLTPKVTFVGFDPSVLLRQLVAHRIAGLERFDGRILRCTVVVEPLGMGLDAGHPVRVHVIVILPGADISVSRDSGQGPFPRDLRLAISQAFDAVEAELRVHHARASRIAPAPYPHFQQRLIVQLDPELRVGVVHGQGGRDYPFGPEGLGIGSGGTARIGSQVRFRLQKGTSQLSARLGTPVIRWPFGNFKCAPRGGDQGSPAAGAG